MDMFRFLFFLLAFFFMVLLGSSLSLASLKPSQIAVLANQNSLESLALADYYMTQRQIPKSHRIDLDLSLQETISRKEYDQSLIEPLRAELEQRGLENTIRVIVAVWGIPLRVSPPKPDVQEVRWTEDAQQWMKSAISLLHEKHEQLSQQITQATLAKISSQVTPKPPNIPSLMNAKEIRKWRKDFWELLNGYQNSSTKDSSSPAIKEFVKGLSKENRQIFGKVGGVKPEEAKAARSAAEKNKIVQVVRSLMHQPTSSKRSNAYALVQEYFGLFGVLALADWEIQQYRYVDGLASVDSELSFLWWKSGTYPLSGRIPNPFYLKYPIKPEDWPLPIVMVSRLDAPTVLQAQGMIDRALETERTGLYGKAYIDSRGMKTGPVLSYGYYDADMQDFAQKLKQDSDFKVVWENTEKRFDRPGQAPDVALYVGWYRLRAYEDAFSFNSGALGYHIASGEAVSIHNPRERGWCKNALERGITVTLGPVGEPYLDAFPLPQEFYGLLFSGKYSLVEAFYLSKRYLSWKMVLFADPLYRPWQQDASRERVLAKKLLESQVWPTPPGQNRWSSPLPHPDMNKMPGKYRPLEVNDFQ